MKLVDFHMHTTHSDGTLTPTELLRQCKEKNLACVSVTDHDTLSSFEEAESEAKRLGIELIPGVEISAVFEPGTLHILGYFLDRKNRELMACLESIQEARRSRNPQIVEKLQCEGVDISLEEVTEEAFAGAGALHEKQIGRPHFAKVLVKKGVVKSIQEAFNQYLGKGRPAYVDKRRVTSKEAIRIIQAAGGVASVAHPKQMRLEEAALEKEIACFKEEGLGGIEVYNSCQHFKENELYLKLAGRFDLVATGGSDFHGANKPGVKLGFLGENVHLGYEMVDKLRARIKKLGKT